MTIVLLQPDGVAITATAERQGSAALYGGGSGRRLGGRSGFRVDTPADTLTADPILWTLKPCAAMIDPGAGTFQGMYGWSSDGNISKPITPADATYARKDIVYIQVNDSSAGDGSGLTSAPVSYLAGTPSATPTAPALPPRSFLVGTIDVPKSGAGDPTATLNPARFVAAGGIQPATLAERDLLEKYDTLTVRRTDVAGKPLEVWNATTGAWRREIQLEVKAASPAAPQLKTGVATVSTDANGTAAVLFDTPFPSAIFGATLTQVKITNIGAVKFQYDETLSNVNRVAFYVYDMAGALVPNLVNLRVSYVAFGH